LYLLTAVQTRTEPNSCTGRWRCQCLHVFQCQAPHWELMSCWYSLVSNMVPSIIETKVSCSQQSVRVQNSISLLQSASGHGASHAISCGGSLPLYPISALGNNNLALVGFCLNSTQLGSPCLGRSPGPCFEGVQSVHPISDSTALRKALFARNMHRS
jgi:hypothetical protein